MKLKIIIIAVFTALLLTSCGNKDYLDTIYTYHYALIKMPDETVLRVNIRQWRDYEGEQIQIIATDGTVYLTSSYNCVLVRNAEQPTATEATTEAAT